MPVNRNALVRFKTIDNCLQNRFRDWTLNDLIDACSDALYEYEGIDKGVSKRSIQADIQMMRSDKLGYNAPIIVVDRKFYTYEDPNYSITNIPLTNQDLDMLSEAIEFMKEFKGFSHFRELESMVQKLEDHVHSAQTHSRPLIDFEKNENLKGLDFIQPLYNAIKGHNQVKITYQSFKARQAGSFEFAPYLLKEYRNRWFVLGKKINKRGPMFLLALDKIISTENLDALYLPEEDFSAQAYFQDVIGVTVNEGNATERVELFINHQHAPYVITKPMHSSQEVIERNAFGVKFALHVKLNFELEREILGFGEHIKVIAPQSLRHNIERRAKLIKKQYESDLHPDGLIKARARFEKAGHYTFNAIYSPRELTKIGKLLDKKLPKSDRNSATRRQIFLDIPELRELLITDKLNAIVQLISTKAKLTRAIFFDKTQEENWFVNWHQDRSIAVKQRENTKGYTGWTEKDGLFGVLPSEDINKSTYTLRIHIDENTDRNGPLQVISGTHGRILTPEEMKIIGENASAQTCTVDSGGVFLMRPLLLHKSSKSTSQKRRRVIHLEFSELELPEGLDYADC